MYDKKLETFFLNNLKKELGQNSFNDWFHNCFITFENNIIIFNVANHFIYNWIKNNYLSEIYNIAFKKNIYEVKIKINTIEKTNNFKIIEKKPINKLNNNITINPDFTFKNFIKDKSNKIAYEACLSIAKNNIIKFNPLYLFGSVGLGKTHLMNAVINMKLNDSDSNIIIYLSAEQFMTKFIKALKEKTILEFKDNFKKANILLIDDFQFLCNKKTTQKEFFHIFNFFLEEKKQLIISANKDVNLLENLDSTIKSRLASGLIVEIQTPENSLKINILKNKIKQNKIKTISEESIIKIINESESIRDLEGKFLKIIQYSEWMKEEINDNFINLIFKEIKIKNNYNIKKNISEEQILNLICNILKINIEDLQSSCRNQKFITARKIAILLFKKYKNLSYIKIGKILGDKKHSTILYLEKQSNKLLETDKNFIQKIQEIEIMLKKII